MRPESVLGRTYEVHLTAPVLAFDSSVQRISQFELDQVIYIFYAYR